MYGDTYDERIVEALKPLKRFSSNTRPACPTVETMG